MGIKTTVTLDEDVLERLKRESRARGISLRETLNELLRTALVAKANRGPRRAFRVKAYHTGYRSGLPHDNPAALIEHAEGPEHR